MRIGIVARNLPELGIGGAERQAWEMASRLAVRNSVTVFTRRHKKANVATVHREGVQIVYTPYLPRKILRPLPHLLHILITVWTVWKRRKQIDVLYCFTIRPGGVIGALVKRLTGLPYCTSVRGGDWYFGYQKWWGPALIRRVFARSDRVIVQTGRIRREIHGRFPEIDPQVIPNGIRLTDTRANGDAVVFVGNLLFRKGVHVLLEAMRGLDRIPLVIVGDGPERARLERMSKGRNVHFTGAADPGVVHRLMVERGRILVLPAVAGEGMPNVIMEALSVGLPVIASDRAGIGDVIDDRYNGILVPPGDSGKLRTAILQLWNDAPLWNRLSTASKSAVAQYAWELVIPRIEDMLYGMTADRFIMN